MVDRIVRRTEQLAEFPMMGAMVTEYDDESIREVLEHPYSDHLQTLARAHRCVGSDTRCETFASHSLSYP